jgi:hypothetical protein
LLHLVATLTIQCQPHLGRLAAARSSPRIFDSQLWVGVLDLTREDREAVGGGCLQSGIVFEIVRLAWQQTTDG